MAEPFFLYPSADFESLVVWDMERQHTLGQLEGHDGNIGLVAARGSLAVSCQYSGPVRARVWNLETVQCTATLPGGDNGAIHWSACCMEGKVLLGKRDGIINMWDVATGAPVALADMEGHSSGLRDIKGAAAGSMVLSGSDDKTMRLWDLRTSNSRCVRTMEGHSHYIWSVDMDGQCRTAVSGSSDKTIKLWDLGSGRCTETYGGHADTIRDVVMHESGSSFLSSEYYSSVICAWAVGSTRAFMRADMASSPVPGSEACYRLFASKDLLTVALCSCITGPAGSRMGVSVWK